MIDCFKSEIENYPHLCVILIGWWKQNSRQRDYQYLLERLQGMTIAFSILGRFELSDEIDILKNVLDIKLTHKYLLDRNLYYPFNRQIDKN